MIKRQESQVYIELVRKIGFYDMNLDRGMKVDLFLGLKGNLAGFAKADTNNNRIIFASIQNSYFV